MIKNDTWLLDRFRHDSRGRREGGQGRWSQYMVMWSNEEGTSETWRPSESPRQLHHLPLPDIAVNFNRIWRETSSVTCAMVKINGGYVSYQMRSRTPSLDNINENQQKVKSDSDGWLRLGRSLCTFLIYPTNKRSMRVGDSTLIEQRAISRRTMRTNRVKNDATYWYKALFIS